MIKANELRIGNLIYEENGTVARVIGMNPFDHSVRCDEEEGCELLIDIYQPDGKVRRGFMSDSNESDPIPLTTEWLERMGFEWDDNRYDGETAIYRKGCLELHHDEDQPKTGYSIALFDDGSISFSGNDIRYVHQLQNLFFALTGVELELKTENHV